MKTNKVKTKNKFSFKRFFLRLIFAFAVFLGLLSFALTRASVQTKLAKMATTYLKNNFQIEASIQRLKITLPNKIEIKNVLLLDDVQDTIISAERIFVQLTSIANQFQDFKVARIAFDNTDFYLYTQLGQEKNGFMLFLDKLKPKEIDEDKEDIDFKLAIGEIDFKNLHFERKDFNNPDLPPFNVKEGRLLAKDFLLNGPEISTFFEKVSGHDGKYFHLYQFRGYAGITSNSIYLKDLKSRTNRSKIDADLSLNFDSFEDFADFENKVLMKGDFRKVKVYVPEVRKLLPVVPDLKTLEIDGYIEGVLNHLEAKKLDLKVGNSIELFGNVEIKHLVDSLNPMHFNVGLSYLKGQGAEAAELLQKYVSEANRNYVSSLGAFNFNGAYVGTLERFKSKGRLQTEVGSLIFDTDADLRKSMKYAIKADATDVDLGKILNQKDLGKLTGNFIIKGTGNTLSNVNMDIEGKIKKIEALGYPYQKISIGGKLIKSSFKGDIKIDDPNLVFEFHGDASLGKPDYLFDFNAILSKANLYALHLSKDTATELSFKVYSALRSNNFEDLVGDLQIEEVSFSNSDAELHTSEILLSALKLGNNEIITLQSDFIDGRIEGTFSLASIHTYISHWIYNQNKLNLDKKELPNHDFEYSFDLINLNNLVYFFNKDLIFYSSGLLQGKISSVDSQFVNILNIGNLRYKDYIFKGIDLRWEGLNAYESALGITLSDLYSSAVKLDTVNMNIRNKSDSLHFELDWVWLDSLGSKGYLAGDFKQIESQFFNLNLLTSYFNIGKEKFIIHDKNNIDFIEDKIYIDNFFIQNGERTLTVNGAISDNEYEILRLSLDNFRIDLFNIFLIRTPFKIDGIMEGEVILSNITKNIQFASDLEVDSLAINGHYQGNMVVNSDWLLGDEKIILDSYLSRGTLKMLELKGNYYTNEEHKINFDVATNRLRMNLLSGISEDFLDNVRGAVTSSLKIEGSIYEPIINGNIQLANFGFSVPMLGTDYNMEGNPEIKITPERFSFENMTLRDNKSNSLAELKGFIGHKGFGDLRFKLEADANKFLALNTTAASGDMYYGTAYVSGKIQIEGPTDDLQMNINVRTDKGTVFALPINNPAEVGRAGFIKFVNPIKDTTLEMLSKTKINNTNGFTLIFNIDVTPDAEAQLVMDERYNDVIKANGSGKIRLVVPPSGDITLNGSYELTRGEYNFSFEGLINKRFQIQPGSLITFNGDPLAANIDISTKYSTRTTLRGLLRDERLLNTRTQVDLLLNITGQVMRPELSFEVSLPRASQLVQAEVSDVLSDKDKLTRQSFALLIFDSFIADDLSLGTANTGTTIAYDALLSQVSNLLGQRLGNIDLQLNYTNFQTAGAEEQQALNTQRDFEIAVSKSFFDDRITVSGALDVPLDNASNAGQRNDFAGDVEIDYSLTPDGRIRAKAFNRSNQNRIDLVVGGDYTQGLGISYRTNFDDFSQIFTPKRKKPNLVEVQESQPIIKEEEMIIENNDSINKK